MVRYAFLVGLAITGGTPALAEDVPAQVKAPVTAKPDPSQKMICRSIFTTGSRLGGQRICQTRQQWDAQSDASRGELEQGMQRATGDPSNGPH